jgi:hypothetical protein
LALLKSVPIVLSGKKAKITMDYIVKSVGKNGAMDFFIKNGYK